MFFAWQDVVRALKQVINIVRSCTSVLGGVEGQLEQRGELFVAFPSSIFACCAWNSQFAIAVPGCFGFIARVFVGSLADEDDEATFTGARCPLVTHSMPRVYKSLAVNVRGDGDSINSRIEQLAVVDFFAVNCHFKMRSIVFPSTSVFLLTECCAASLRTQLLQLCHALCPRLLSAKQQNPKALVSCNFVVPGITLFLPAQVALAKLLHFLLTVDTVNDSKWYGMNSANKMARRTLSEEVR